MNKGKKIGQEKEASLSGDGDVDSCLTVIMFETENNISNNNGERGTID